MITQLTKKRSQESGKVVSREKLGDNTLKNMKILTGRLENIT